MNVHDLKKEELVSLNSELTEFCLLELEERLETDPLAVGGLVDLVSSGEMPLVFSEACKYCGAGSNCNIH